MTREIEKEKVKRELRTAYFTLCIASFKNLGKLLIIRNVPLLPLF